MTRRERRLPDDRRAGFTLLEVLVSLTILGLILVALTNGVRFAGQAWERQERGAGKRGDTDAVQNILRTLIAGGTQFNGTAGALQFVGEMPQGLARGGLYDIELHSEGDGLMLSWKPHFKGASKDNSASTEMGRGIEAVSLAYYYGGSKSWDDMTHEKGPPPDLIRVIFRAAHLANLPPLLVAPEMERVTAVTK
jgi:prepilin-type N-terminal cleavage/methylation domain-containing protein